MTDFADSALAASISKPPTPSADHVASGQDGDNKFQKAISAWRTIDLTSMIPSLDNTASEIVQYQRDSTVQRKDLAQKTKDFRKLDDSAKLGEIKGLLKAYQTFIDLLTNHSKSTNSAFLQVYSSLSEAPDPYPLLEASVDSLLLSEDTLPKITQENEHLQKSVSKLTSQLEETESRLQAERTTRKGLEEGLETKVKEVESSWAAVLEEKKDNWEAKEKSLEEKLENQERLLNEIKASYEVNQRLGQSENGDADGSRGHVTSAELEMVNSDLERTSVRLAEVEARNEQLRIELAQSASQVPSQAALALEDDPAYMRLRSENSSLMRKLDAARVERDAKKRDLDAKLRSLEREVGMLKEERDSLKSKVQKWSDYEDVKQELEVLKSIEFSMGDDDDQDVSGGVSHSQETPGNGSTGKGKGGETLEQLLLARNKKLSDELTVLRVSHQDLQSRLQTMQDSLTTANTELERVQRLNTTLENDLANVQGGVSAYPSAPSVAGTYASRYPQSAISPFASRNRKTSPTSSIISGFDPRTPLGSTPLEVLRSGEPVGGGSGILPMVTAQRDRFKQRNSQLENELAESHRTVSSLRQEIASLQKDNLNLYEKTRYVSTYNRAGHPASSASSYATNPNPSTVQVSSSTSSGLALNRYRSAYESNISPFAAFRGRESARAYKRMSLPERIVFSITRMVLATRTSRNLFAGYCVALHLMVFFSLYWLGSVDADQHGSHLSQAAVVAAGSAGGVVDAAKGAQHGDWHQEGFNGKAS
ncbi:Golgi membrane protein [Rutstroemia sp. NJR-2017a BBW]|nr:Golgi membrane protein [Rutstroemia sp. NJR-2017a BBW]